MHTQSARVVRGAGAGSRPAGLAESYGAAVSLEFLRLAFFVPMMAAALLRGALGLGRTALGTQILAALVLLFLLGPLRLGIKRWYLAAGGGYCSPHAALEVFAGPRAYFSAVWYGVVRRLAGFLAFFAPLLPALLIAAALRAAYGAAGVLAGGAALLLVLLAAALGAAAVFFGVYLWLGLFFADYRYAQGEHSPFAALRDSWRLAGGNRGALAARLLAQIPRALLCLAVAPFPFSAPKIGSSLAGYARAVLPHSD